MILYQLFATGAVSLIPCMVHLDLQISPRIFERSDMTLTLFSGAWEKMIYKKAWSQKFRDTVPLNVLYLIETKFFMDYYLAFFVSARVFLSLVLQKLQQEEVGI